MKVILNNDVTNLGEEGDVKDVAPGYARNYLIPKGIVMPYSRQNLALLESRRATIEKRKEDKREQAKSTRERLENEPVTIKMTAGEKGKLFGSVNSQTIAEELEKRGVDVERKKIDIDEGTIKMLGTHTVRVRLYGEEEAQLKVVVEPDEKSAARQKTAEKKTEASEETASAGTPEAQTAGASSDTQTEAEPQPSGEESSQAAEDAASPEGEADTE
ncbi:MAG: 50S ribosomal protein L9 [Spirochaetota bacterium]